MSNNNIPLSGKQRAPIDHLISNSLSRLKNHLVLISNYRIKQWKGLLVIAFIAGAVSAWSWAVSTNTFNKIFATQEQTTITNIAQTVYQDSSGANYGPVSSKAINITLTTSSDKIPPSPITNLSADEIRPHSIELTWTASGDDGLTGDANSYDIRFKTSALNEQQWSSATVVPNPPSPKIAGSKEEFHLEKLTSNTNYWIGIKTADEALNWSDISNIVKIKTPMKKEKIKIKIEMEGRKEDFQAHGVKVYILKSGSTDATDILETKAEQDTDEFGEVEIALDDIGAETYDLMVVLPGYLSKKIANADLSRLDEIEFKQLAAGNLDDSDDIINSKDWALMRNDWGKQGASASDLNQDNLVNSLDWSLMNKNWDKQGSCPDLVCP